MALVDDIEFYGRAVDAGDMLRDDAVKALASQNVGDLTSIGAADCIDNWQKVRGEYQQVYRNAARTLDKIYGLDDATKQ